MKVELYAGNDLISISENIMSDEMCGKFWKAVEEKEDITVYYGSEAVVSYDYCESDELWDTYIQNCKDNDWYDGGYLDSSYHSSDLHIPIREVENFLKNGW